MASIKKNAEICSDHFCNKDYKGYDGERKVVLKEAFSCFQVSGKVVTSADVQNIKTSMREKNKSQNQVDKVLSIFQKIPGATESSSLPCSELLFPRAFKSRGRPKGATLTCLGMPSKHCKSISFASKPTREKQKLMLQWLFGSGQDYNISNIQSVPSQFLDGQVQECLYLLKDFLDLNVLKEMINKCSNEEWMCGTCSNDLRDVRSVSCDSCLKWFHFSCAGIKRPPSKKEWFCKACRK
ncbi:hypothetical protein HELRODRAFT_169178 [Helobdella robusta]|uniref:PHD-type domain-containing protein n=1 Tax=Helobdella robusta TaxID=6412 RepID=T1F1J0_HELRO|nr:hypothetical protein HELRODRAFT_169178 [Helobdella robusta]ESO08363.1 hypothetical protein HELRODRAFT_169178 [Helobdella robusta]